MRVTVVGIGSTGVVRPLLALAGRLRERGHTVRFATHEVFADEVRRVGASFAPVAGDPRGILQGADGEAWLSSNNNPLRLLPRAYRAVEQLIPQVIEDVWAASEDADLLIGYVLAAPIVQMAAEVRGIPWVVQACYPIVPSRELPPAFGPRLTHAPSVVVAGYNELLPRLLMASLSLLCRRPLNRFRTGRFGLDPIPLSRPACWTPRPNLTLLSYSRSLLTPPADWETPVRVTGYWFLNTDEAWRPPTALERFLSGGPTPIYIGFGSMVSRDAEQMLEVTLRALEKTGQRGVLLSGWGGLAKSDVPDTVYLGDSIPHDWLFPRMAAAVHHAGAGTTHASLAAGLPTVCIPFFADQFLWARQVAELGAGPRPVPRSQLNVDRLASAIDQAVHASRHRLVAEHLAAQMKQEAGLDAALDALETIQA